MTIAWSFNGSSNNHEFAWVAYSGVDSVRGSNSGQNNPPPGVAFTASSGDMISVACGAYVSGDSYITSWTNATAIADYWDGVYSNLAIGEKSATGDVTITPNWNTIDDGGTVGFVLIPTGASASAVPANRGNLGMMMGMSVGMWFDNEFLKPTGGN